MSLGQRVRAMQKQCWDADSQPTSDVFDLGWCEQRYISRKISIWITYFLVKCPRITPNHVTAAWLVLGVAGALLMGWGTYSTAVAGAICLYLTWILDCVDGEVSRYHGIVSIEGNFTDMVGHHVLFPLVFAALTFDLARQDAGLAMLALGLLAAALITPLNKMSENINILLLLEYLARHDDNPFRVAQVAAKSTDERAASGCIRPSLSTNCKALLSFLVSQCCMHYMLLVAALAGQVQAFIVFYGVCVTVLFLPKFLAQRRALGRKARDPALLGQQFRADWVKASTPEAAAEDAVMNAPAGGE